MTIVYEDRGDEAADEIPLRRIRFSINGARKIAEVEPRLLLSHLIRRGIGLTGTHMGCDTTNCGACTVLVDAEPVSACIVLAAQVAGAEITTAAGLLDRDGSLGPLQRAFHEHHAAQCGFCTPGMLMAAAALLSAGRPASRQEIRAALHGNLCRCTGYGPIVDAVEAAQQGQRR